MVTIRLLILSCLLLGATAGCQEPTPPAPATVPARPPQDPSAEQAPVVAAPSAPAAPHGKTDAQRMEDVHAIVRGIKEYRRRTGRLPFDETFRSLPEGAEVSPINVNLARGELAEEYREPPPGMPGAVISGEEFAQYMRRQLGEEFTLPFDPAPAPRFYQVHFDGRDYYVSAALYEPNEHTLPMADDWHKYQVGSRPDPELRIRAVEEVLQQ